jgi:hypothetical protein
MPFMEKLIADIESFAAEFGITPQKLLRDAINAEWGRWQKWKAGEASPTMLNADKIYAHMAACRRGKDAA